MNYYLEDSRTREWDHRLERVGAYVGEIPTNQKFELGKKEYLRSKGPDYLEILK